MAASGNDAFDQKTALVRDMIHARADIERRNIRGATPLLAAAGTGCYDTAVSWLTARASLLVHALGPSYQERTAAASLRVMRIHSLRSQ